VLPPGIFPGNIDFALFSLCFLDLVIMQKFCYCFIRWIKERQKRIKNSNPKETKDGSRTYQNQQNTWQEKDLARRILSGSL
jgi:hypothetical protein